MMNHPRTCLLPSPALFQQVGKTALDYAKEAGHTEVVLVLGGTCTLFEAAEAGLVIEVEKQVAEGTNKDLQDEVWGPWPSKI